MNQDLTIYIVAVIVAGILSTFLCFYSNIKVKEAPGARYYSLVTLLSAFFSFSYVFELTSGSLEQMKFWLRMEYLALPFIPLFTLFMCFEYVGQKIKKWIYYSLFTLPFLTIFLHSTNDLHHLYYKSIKLSTETPFPILKLEGALWFYVHSVFVFACIMFSVIILLMQLKNSLFRFKMQILTMTAGLIVPIVANYFYLNGLSPYGIDLGPVSMSITFLFHGAALVSYQMFNVAPIARDTVFLSMSEGVIVLNQSGIIVDYNPAIKKVLPRLNPHVIGRKLMDLLEGNMELLEIISKGQEKDYKALLEEEIIHYHIRFSPVEIKNRQEIGKIITFVDVTDRVILQEKLQQIARMDGLTHVYNRSYFMRRAQKTIDSLNQTCGSVSLIMFDIDHFKQINDTYGHEAGDSVLINVAAFAKESLGDKGIIGRYGGEEFIMCLPNTTLIEAYMIANWIRAGISENFIQNHDKQIKVTASFGISNTEIYADENNYTIHVLMREADKALYEAKRNGRNCVQTYEDIKIKKVHI